MVASLLIDRADPRAIAGLLRPMPLAGGSEPEERFIVCGMGWRRYLALDEALGADRPNPRTYYLDGSLEIMTTSSEHERLKEWIGGFMDLYFDHIDAEIFTRGQATMRSVLAEAGAEPDKSWCLGSEKESPDLVLEIALTSGGLDKLEIYRRFQVPEVWIWRKEKLEIHLLRGDGGGYIASPRSRLLPELDPDLIVRCLALPRWREARRAFRAGFVSR
jgi:Uma2 family endonuclease